jgi:hypothetical protein
VPLLAAPLALQQHLCGCSGTGGGACKGMPRGDHCLGWIPSLNLHHMCHLCTSRAAECRLVASCMGDACQSHIASRGLSRGVGVQVPSVFTL